MQTDRQPLHICTYQSVSSAIEKVLTKVQLEIYSRSLVLLIHLRVANELPHSRGMNPESVCHVQSLNLFWNLLCLGDIFV